MFILKIYSEWRLLYHWQWTDQKERKNHAAFYSRPSGVVQNRRESRPEVSQGGASSVKAALEYDPYCEQRQNQIQNIEQIDQTSNFHSVIVNAGFDFGLSLYKKILSLTLFFTKKPFSKKCQADFLKS